MHRSTEIEVKVGIFVAVGLVLTMMSILLIGGGQQIFQRATEFSTKFGHTEGIIEGAIVKIAGVRVGQVSTIEFIKESGQVKVTFTVGRKYAENVHNDSLVGVATQGVLGDRYLVLSSGTAASGVAPPGSELKSEAPKDLKDYLTDADAVLGRLKSSLTHIETIMGSFARENRSEVFFRNITGFSQNASEGTKNLKASMAHFNNIMTKIDNGEGTIGALINDPSLYDDLKALLGGANRNRVLKYFIKKSVDESREAAQKNKPDAPSKEKRP